MAESLCRGLLERVLVVVGVVMAVVTRKGVKGQAESVVCGFPRLEKTFPPVTRQIMYRSNNIKLTQTEVPNCGNVL